MSTHVGDIFFDAKVDRKQYDKDLSALDKSAGKLKSKLATAFGVGAFGKFIKDATQAGASLNAMNTIIDASLPNMRAKVDEFAKSAGAMFGLSETQAKGFVGKFASMASAMGYTEKQAYTMSTALTGLAGDVASYYHITQDEAYTKLGAVFTGETESLKQLGVIMTQNALDAFALEQGYGRVTSQMSELEKTTLRYQFVMDRLKLTAGDFAKYANTWSGSIATIKLNWSNFMATMGQGIINILLPLLRLIAQISNALTALASRFLGWTQRITGQSKGLGAIKDAVGKAFGKNTQKQLNTSAGGLGNVGNATKGVGSNAGKAKKAVQALKRELMGFDQITKLTKQDASTGTTGAGGVGGGGGGIGGGGIDLGGYEDVTDTVNALNNIQLPKPLTDALTHLKEAFSGLLDVIKDFGKWAWDEVLKPLGEWMLEKGLPAQIETFASAIDLVTSALKLIGSILKPLWEPLVKPFLKYWLDYKADQITFVGKAFEVLAKVLDSARVGWEKLKAVGGELVLTLNDKFSDVWDKVKGKWDSIKTKTQELAITLKDKFTSVWNGIKEKWTNFKSKFGAYTKEVTIKLKDKFTNIWNKLKEKWKNFKSKFGGKTSKSLTLSLTDKFSSAWKRIKGAWNAIKSKTATLTFGFKNLLKDKWNALARAVNGAKSRAPAIVSAVLPSMPYLAQGGYVKKNTPQLAMIGDNKTEGEIVAPESKLMAMAEEVAKSNQNTELLTAILNAINNIDTNVYLDGEKIKNNTVKRINQHTRQTGRLELIV